MYAIIYYRTEGAGTLVGWKSHGERFGDTRGVEADEFRIYPY